MTLEELAEKEKEKRIEWLRTIEERLAERDKISFKAGYDKRESEFVYNPDYLNFKEGVKVGRELEKEAALKPRLDRPTLRAEILSQLVNECQTHEHRGCVCSPKEAEGCWGYLAAQILAIFPDDKKLKREGMEIVVEWVETLFNFQDDDTTDAMWLKDSSRNTYRKWQAFKKEKGIVGR